MSTANPITNSKFAEQYVMNNKTNQYLDLVDLTQYVGVTYFKQLESFTSGTYAIAHSEHVNTIVIHTYPYQAF